MESSREAFLSLVRLGIGHSAGALPSVVDWHAVRALAERQGLSGVVLDGVEVLRKRQSGVELPDKLFLAQWIGEVLQGFECRYESYCKTIAEMAAFYNAHGFKMMVLKGYSCSLNWPRPEHRPCGDIDIWLFGRQKEADAVMAKELGVKFDKSHHHHTVFSWGGFSVENHYDFGNVHHHKSSVALEKVFKGLGEDDSHYVEVASAASVASTGSATRLTVGSSSGSATRVYLPSQNLHALFLLKHSMTDFAAFFVTLRQVLDWAFHVEKYGKEIDWDWLRGVVEQYHMMDFFNCINAICVEDLGFDSSLFGGVQFNPALKEKILADILSPEFSRVPPDGRFLPRALYMFRRWKGNGWKHKLCYNESMWSAFWSGLWSHLIKPKNK